MINHVDNSCSFRIKCPDGNIIRSQILCLSGCSILNSPLELNKITIESSFGPSLTINSLNKITGSSKWSIIIISKWSMITNITHERNFTHSFLKLIQIKKNCLILLSLLCCACWVYCDVTFESMTCQVSLTLQAFSL